MLMRDDELRKRPNRYQICIARRWRLCTSLGQILKILYYLAAFWQYLMNLRDLIWTLVSKADAWASEKSTQRLTTLLGVLS